MDRVSQWSARHFFRLRLPREGRPLHEEWRRYSLKDLNYCGPTANERMFVVWLRDVLHLPDLMIVDFRKTGSKDRPFIEFRVLTLRDAEEVVAQRHRFKQWTPQVVDGRGTPADFTIFDVLCPEEAAQHALLFPRFLAARRAGKRAQFTRACLRVDGVIITP